MKQKRDTNYIKREREILVVKERYKDATFSETTNKELMREAIKQIYKKYPL